MYNLKQLRRLRWIVLVVVVVFIAASVAVNAMHAPPTLAARLVSAGPPLAVFAALELITRIPHTSRARAWARVSGAATVAVGAAAISYAQQRAAVGDLGFATWEASIWPLIIDGLMVIASVSLVEVIAAIRIAEVAATRSVTFARPVRGGDGAVIGESPETVRYRAAVEQMRRESRLSAMNGATRERETA
jgi:uncharacterized protein DUF2637